MVAFLMVLVLVSAYLGAFVMLRMQSEIRLDFKRFAPVLVVFAITALISGSQFIEPEVLTALDRDRGALTDGQLWRLVTPLFVQDGGGSGTIYNLVVLLMLGIPAALLVGSRLWLLVYFGTGVASEVVAYTLIHQGFAGNSIANFGVAALISLVAIWMRRRPASIIAIVTLASGGLLLVLSNLHGAAFLIGSLISLVVFWRRPQDIAVELANSGHSSIAQAAPTRSTHN